MWNYSLREIHARGENKKKCFFLPAYKENVNKNGNNTKLVDTGFLLTKPGCPSAYTQDVSRWYL